MLAIAVLFGLAIWFFITIFATVIGYKTGKKFGAFIGFMLTMGGWIIYWIAEYHYIQYKVNHLCKTEGGVTVYITPEEWRKMIGEHWENMKPLDKDESEEIYDIRKNNILHFNNNEYVYYSSTGKYVSKDEINTVLDYYFIDDRVDLIPRYSVLVVDSVRNKPLFMATNFSYRKFISFLEIWRAESFNCAVNDGWGIHLKVSPYLNSKFR